MIDSKRLAFFISLLIYVAAVPIGFATGDVMVVRVIFLVIFTATWCYGLRAGLICILLSVPIDGFLFAWYYQDWGAVWWTFHPLARVMQLFLAFTLGRFKVVHEQLELTESALRERTHQLETALAQVRELKGIIRICAACRNVHNDDGSWISVEKFITERSHAMFSHGFCPACYQEQIAQLTEKQRLPG